MDAGRVMMHFRARTEEEYGYWYDAFQTLLHAPKKEDAVDALKTYVGELHDGMCPFFMGV